jgi:sarcosine oxidase
LPSFKTPDAIWYYCDIRSGPCRLFKECHKITSCELAIVGLGAVGSAALLAASRQGIDALGIDRYAPPHNFGSTHGESRIVRAAIGEGASYTPLALRSFALWDRLAEETGVELVRRCGAVVLGEFVPGESHAEKDFYKTTTEAAVAHGIPHEILTAEMVRERFPAFGAFNEGEAYFEPGAGLAFPERVVAQQINLATKLGGRVALNTSVHKVFQNEGGVRIKCANGEIAARRAIICAGPWMRSFLPPAWASSLEVTRQTVHWFDVVRDKPAHDPSRMPVFIWRNIYGFPMVGGADAGIKIAGEDMSAFVDPDDAPRNISTVDVDAIEAKIRSRFPQCGRHLRGEVCLYTKAPYSDFRVGRHPNMDDVTIASACSGHGFKHSAALGEALVKDPSSLVAWDWPAPA